MRCLAPLFLILLLLAPLPSRAISGITPTLVFSALSQRVADSFVRGAEYYFQTVGGWIGALLSKIGIGQERSERRTIVPRFGPCDQGEACEKGSVCQRSCPDGMTCDVKNRCVGTKALAACNQASLPPGPFAWRLKAGICRLEEIDPRLPRVACPTGAEGVVCPEGTRPACTPSAAGPRVTCLAAPLFGGACLEDEECSAADCGEAVPFCDGDQRCKCRKSTEAIVSCATVDDCAGAACPDGQALACTNGACGCATTGFSDACESVSDCQACPEGAVAACEQRHCVCQRKTENVPVACAAVSDCAGVSCPEGYSKDCREQKCVCVR